MNTFCWVGGGSSHMAQLPYIKFFPSDWLSDERLILASLPAKGLWICLLAIMAKNERRGYLAVNGGVNPPLRDIARLVGATEAEIEPLIEELKTRGICSVEDGTGILFSRRLVRDTNAYHQSAEFGRLGGNPRVKARVKGGVNPSLNGGVAGGGKPSLAMAMASDNGISVPTAEEIYTAYPKKVGRGEALKAIGRAMTRKSPAFLLERTTAYYHACFKWPKDEAKFIPNASTWFNQERYDDDPTTWERKAPSRANSRSFSQTNDYSGITDWNNGVRSANEPMAPVDPLGGPDQP